MASAETVETFACTPEQFYKIVTDYERYPEFLGEVKECEIIKTEGNRKLVSYRVSVMKSFEYQLWMTEDQAGGKVSWEFASGDLFKTSKGFWKLEEQGGETRATYAVEATFSMFVPGPLAKALVTVNLPNMMSSYRKRVGELYGR